MFQHNLLLAYRNFQRNKNSFFINLIGLSTGLACTILIYLWVQDELGFDKFHKNDAQLFQVMQNLNRNENDVHTWEWTPGILAKSLKEEMPEVGQAIQLARLGSNGIIGTGDVRFKAVEIFTENDFFDLFSFELIEGNKASVLKNKNDIIISEKLAEKLFNTTDNIIGKTIFWERNWENVTGDYTIAGVVKNPPVNSSMQFDVLFSYDLFLENNPDVLEWRNSDPLTYITLKEGTDVNDFNQKINGFIQQKLESSKSTLFIRKYSDQYLYGKYENGVQAGGRISYVRLFSVIALFIILIACINFMNLSTAKSTKRFKEVGIKKTVGANRKSLVFQYLSESVLLAFVSLFLALSIIGFILPQFNVITDKQLSLNIDSQLIMACLGITFFTGIIAGSYPAFYLSGFKPVNILKGTINKSWGELWARKGLVVFQFTLSVLLIVAVLVVYNQLQFIQNKNLGYNKDNVMVFHKDGEIKENIKTFLNEAKNISGVASATTYDGTMTGNYGYTTSMRWEGYEDPENPIRFGVMIVGDDIVKTMGMELISGRDYSGEFSTENAKIIINEAAAEAIGFDEPLGKTIRHRQQEYEIVGVVKNFHFESLYDEVKPCVLKRGAYGNRVYVKIKKGQEKEAIASMEKLYADFNPGLPFEFNFIDEQYQELYISEKRVATLSSYFAGFAILISCLGLFGLAAFTAERRAKEISIRKILGSTTFGIAQLLSGELTKMVFIAICIALPVGFLFANKWLNSFAFHIELKPWMFAVAGFSAIVIAAATVSFQSIKAALINPVESLRSE